MPGRNGKGPASGGGGRMGGPVKAGPEGSCRCPECGFKVAHRRGVPCSAEKCPQCGTMMVRD
ncbi:hypothetical protein [Youngiibacter fragilis]|uniref:hypothetical protein n=1 Tax=Youngiibacter fragilis TaxID=1408819 RepID=UPI000411601C|nr:hypothetical protein [Youngiibacter fragilis]